MKLSVSKGGIRMNLIDDPSIFPEVITDLEGNILKVRTYGLHCYGFHDFIMEDNFENYQEIFGSLIDRTLNFSFDYYKDWFIDGRLFRTEIRDDGLAYIKDIVDIKTIRTLTIYHPTINQPMRYESLGLEKLYEHPEFFIQASITDSNGLIAFAISEVEKGFVYDEDCIITYEGRSFEIIRSMDRYGKDRFKIIERV
jgi:hypothetical protein